MSKIKFALLKDTFNLPTISVMKKTLKVKNICAARNFKNKTAAWVNIRNNQTFAMEVGCDYEELFDIKINGFTELYAFSSDANSTMLCLLYPNNVVAMFEADDVDGRSYMDAHWARDTLDRFSKCYDNDEHINFVLSKLPFSKSQINKLDGFKLIDKKQFEFVRELRETYNKKMRLIVDNGWS